MAMPKVTVSISDDIYGELVSLVPVRQRSRLINSALKKALHDKRKASAMAKMVELRKKTATFSTKDILRAVRDDRARQR